jgi:hypothetical protein
MHPASRLLGERMAIDVHHRWPEQAEEWELGIDANGDDESAITDLPPHGDALDEIAGHVTGQQCPRPSLSGP